VASFKLGEKAVARLEAELRKMDPAERSARSPSARNPGGYRNRAPSPPKFVAFDQTILSPAVMRRGHNLRKFLYALAACVIAVPIAYGLSLQGLFPDRAPLRASEPVSTLSERGNPPSPPSLATNQIETSSPTSPAKTAQSERTVSGASEVPSQIAAPSPKATISSESETPAAPSAPMPQDQSVATGGRKLDAEEIKLLMERGRQLLADGDLPSARLVFQRAAEAGDATAALALGASYDATILGRLGLVGLSADADRSRAWYEKAAALGSAEAARRLEFLAKR
jgi:hypothetical protein